MPGTRDASDVTINGVHHVSINVKNVDEAIDFYTDVIGLTTRADRPDFSFGGAWLDVGGQQIHLIEGDVPPALGQHFALLVEDLDAVVATLRARGVEVTDPRSSGANRQAFLDDPAGNHLELHEVARAPH
jgi:catechol 2,3-dioxygenase-like lactoylglutathione lyase family enzyme